MHEPNENEFYSRNSKSHELNLILYKPANFSSLYSQNSMNQLNDPDNSDEIQPDEDGNGIEL